MRQWILEFLLLLVSLPLWVAGWIVGFIVACVLWGAASIVAGYQAGQGVVNEHRGEHP